MVDVGPAFLPHAWQTGGKHFQHVMVYIFILSQQNMARKEHHMSELDVNQMEGGPRETLVQIIGQTYSCSIKSVIKISIYKNLNSIFR